MTSEDLRVLALIPLKVLRAKCIFTTMQGHKVYRFLFAGRDVTNSVNRLDRLKLVKVYSGEPFALVWEPMPMRHHLTDFDHAVLAALTLKLVKVVRLDLSRVEYTLNGVNVWPSLLRLEQAGEVRVTPKQELLFPGTEKWRKYEEMLDTVRLIKKGIRDGTIKVEPAPKSKKGPKP